jgi:hypothetical protein
VLERLAAETGDEEKRSQKRHCRDRPMRGFHPTLASRRRPTTKPTRKTLARQRVGA